MRSSCDGPLPRRFDPDASLVLIGIRGCGKRSLGLIACTALQRRFITEDHYFREVTGYTRQEFLQKFGSLEFQRRDVEVLKMMLDNHRTSCVLEIGLGSLTRTVQDHLRIYSSTNPVVYLLRDMDRIQSFLKLEDQSARILGDSDSLHRRCSNLEFYNVEDQSSGSRTEEESPDRRSIHYSFKLKDAQEEFTRFVRFITGAPSHYSGYDSPFALLETPPELRSYTHAIFIRFSDLLDGAVDLAHLESGGDAVELCVDRWDRHLVATISKQISLLRRATKLPMIYSVDTVALLANHGNSSVFPTEDIYFDALEHGLRLGVEYLAVDLSQDPTRVSQIISNKGRTKIIGHYLFEPSSAISWEHEGCLALFLEAERLGCQIVRILRVATEREENEAVRRFIDRVKALQGPHAHLIAYNVGAIGRTTQVFNRVLTSVTHPAILRQGDHTRDPQITSRDAVHALFESYVLDPLQFYIIGASVAYSLSPAMHNAAFRHCGMGHTYQIPQSASLIELDRLGRDPNFGGTSIVQPWRVEITQRVAAKSRHAEAIGAVNTLLPLRAAPDGTMLPLPEQAQRRNQAGQVAAWYGENTDWIGVLVCIRRHLSPRNAISPVKSTALVIGAGGMARAVIYAMLQLGCRKIFLYNRTLERAESVARHFNSWIGGRAESHEVVRVLRSAPEHWPADSYPPCIIASCVPADTVGDEPPAKFEVPLQWLGNPTGGVILELAYKPLDTPLLRQMRRFRRETGRHWVLVDGLEIVAEQAMAQFELLTGRKAPRRLMQQEVLRNYAGEQGAFDEKTIQARMEGVH